MSDLVAQGLLRSKRTFQMGGTFMPSLYNQVELDLENSKTTQEMIDDSVKTVYSSRAEKHKNAIFLEMRRRKDAEDEKCRQIELARQA